MMTQHSESPSDVAAFHAAYDHLKPALPGAGWLRELRHVAMTRFLSLGLPGRRAEQWRYADLSPLRKGSFSPVTLAQETEQARIDAAAVPGLDGPRLVFINGRFQRALSRMEGLPADLAPQSLREVLITGGGSLRDLITDLRDGDAFDQLNTAMMSEGVVIDVPKGLKVETPVEIVYLVDDADDRAAHLRVVVRLGEGASLKLIESFKGDDSRFFTNLITQTTIADDAHLTLIRRQHEGAGTVHISRIYATLGRGALAVHHLATGGQSARHELRADFTTEGGDVRYQGIQLARPHQTLDTLTFLDHAVPDCTSDQAYRGVLAADAVASFQGKVLVRRDAQKTDAKQKSDSLLLDRSATSNAKPELEIYADDVQCAHGSTVGELSTDQLFYLMARGLSPLEAKAMLVEAFIAALCDGVPDEAARNAFIETARGWLQDPDVPALAVKEAS
jgi:Fe-S cluster assembly protein SufD